MYADLDAIADNLYASEPFPADTRAEPVDALTEVSYQRRMPTRHQRIQPRMHMLLATCLLGACSTTGTTDATTSGLRLTTAGSFTSSASANLAAKTTTATCSSLSAPITGDAPEIADGLDCDADGGIVAHITPSQYRLAFKRVTLVPASGSTAINLIADTGTLAKSTVIDFTTADASETVITISPGSLSAGTYTGIEAELYYFEMTFSVGGTTRHVRTYMSDDDFAAEGSLGHHQGDITFLSDAGVELGWIDSTWGDTLSSTRGNAQNGAGGTDSETGHARGFFGNAALWDDTLFKQGSGQDRYLLSLTFTFPLAIPDPSSISTLTTITATFSIADTFFYEDFTPQGTGFAPGSGGEALGETYQWAPLTPDATIAVTTE